MSVKNGWGIGTFVELPSLNQVQINTNSSALMLVISSVVVAFAVSRSDDFSLIVYGFTFCGVYLV